MQLTIGDDFFEVICEQLAANVDSGDSFSDSLAIDVRHDVSETESAINHQATVLLGIVQLVSVARQICGIRAKNAFETVFFKEQFTETFLN
jgi:hypothetical protein